LLTPVRQRQYIDKTFSLAAPNITINGLPVDIKSYLSSQDRAQSTTEEVYESFDGRKRQRVEDLTREEEDLLREIAALKWTIPTAAAQKLDESFKDGVMADEAALDAKRTAIQARGGGDVVLEVPVLERQEDVEKAFRDAVDGLARLKKEMPATVARMERARVAGEYVLTER
jgi:kinetochor protein Mis14/NSL1